MYVLDGQLWFPPPHEADPEGLLALGGDLSPPRLLLAYRSGIFPWFNEGQPLLWWSPDPRMVLFPGDYRPSKSLRSLLAKKVFTVTRNSCFEQVIHQCAQVVRKGQRGTWITAAMEEAYVQLHEQGHAHSWEVWREGRLVGGLYGVDLPESRIFCGESMFSLEANASKVAFYHFVSELGRQSYTLIDCQQPTEHLSSMGAVCISREEFLSYLNCPPGNE